ncbi:hypothetical protein LQZ21_03940 [Treponema sp. TIM-1]|uniref:MGH1-like glycoside hydrolase domain-containing protein n=1 Tax=Treponema sp. TIM-1 TaxID=2898417 RepID=UPI00397F3B4C
MDMLAKLRETHVESRVGEVETRTGRAALDEFIRSGVKFAASHPKIEGVYYRAVRDLARCVVPSASGGGMLIEGAVFLGAWLESTGTISAELLSRFCPEAARLTFELFADFQREDGLIPYKLLPGGPNFRQVQMVSPLARSVWNHYCLHGNKGFLEKMYRAISRNDQWLEKYRNTRGTGCVEAFCTFDTGSDASPRFWQVPDTPYGGDPARYDPDSPVLPFLAPDMTANVYCQRKYLALMARELGIPDPSWEAKARQSRESLMRYCYDETDHYFYDRDRHDRFVRIQSDTLIRVLACEAGDDALFEDALRRYLLNTKKFFCRYPITTIAMDEPGFSQSFQFNSWAGQVSFLTQIRLPHAFDYHHRPVELTWIQYPIIAALSRFEKFPGSLDAWLGHEGYGENYTPTMLCVLDYLERLSGIFPTPGGDLWFTALVPRGIDHGESVAEETGYSRMVDNARFEFVNQRELSGVYKNGELLYQFPPGVRVVTDRRGALRGLIGMSVRRITGTVVYQGRNIPFAVSGNERLEYSGTSFVSIANPGVIPPNYGEPDTLTL